MKKIMYIVILLPSMINTMGYSPAESLGDYEDQQLQEASRLSQQSYIREMEEQAAEKRAIQQAERESLKEYLRAQYGNVYGQLLVDTFEEEMAAIDQKTSALIDRYILSRNVPDYQTLSEQAQLLREQEQQIIDNYYRDFTYQQNAPSAPKPSPHLPHNPNDLVSEEEEIFDKDYRLGDGLWWRFDLQKAWRSDPWKRYEKSSIYPPDSLD